MAGEQAAVQRVGGGAPPRTTWGRWVERGREGLILLLVLLLLSVGLPLLCAASLRMARAEGEREERLFTGEDW